MICLYKAFCVWSCHRHGSAAESLNTQNFMISIQKQKWFSKKRWKSSFWTIPKKNIPVSWLSWKVIKIIWKSDSKSSRKERLPLLRETGWCFWCLQEMLIYNTYSGVMESNEIVTAIRNSLLINKPYIFTHLQLCLLSFLLSLLVIVLSYTFQTGLL